MKRIRFQRPQKMFSMAVFTIATLALSGCVLTSEESEKVKSATETEKQTGNQTGTITPVSDKVNETAQKNTEIGVGSSNIDDGSKVRIATVGVSQCFWGSLQKGQKEEPIVKINHAVTADLVDVELIFSPAFVDLTYGKNKIGWKNHTFNLLVTSDHVEVGLLNGNGETAFHGKIDLLSKTDKVPSGYASLGFTGGDGNLTVGKIEDVVSFGTSFDDNLNYHGYHLFTDSPATDSVFTPNPNYPFWEFRAIYRVTVKAEIFGPSGYGSAHMTSVHASPSKNGIETVDVLQKTCPVPGSPGDPFTPTKIYDPTEWID